MNKMFPLLLRFPLLFLICCLCPCLTWAQAGAWESLAPSNTPKWVGHPVVVNNKMYVFSGFDNASVHTTDKNEVYDPATNQWAYLVPMPYPVTHAGAVADGEKVYITGGFLGSNAATNLVQVYHIPSNTWSLGPALPAASSSHALVRVGRRLHSLGGLKPDRKTDTGLHYVLDLDNPAAGWEMAAPLPEARNHLASAVVAGKIYVLGGQQGHDGPTLEVAYAHVYDPATDTWSRLRDLPYGRS
ncbi:MAG: Kelch repeat-containing protein, partial [Adhaeribacter sp.]